jgi:predicted RNA binding protein YcfA (HicA-like mRNA interferase family)
VKVRDVIKLVERDGWYYVGTTGSHRHYKHPIKKGKVTIAGHPGEDIPLPTYKSILRQAQISTRRES